MALTDRMDGKIAPFPLVDDGDSQAEGLVAIIRRLSVARSLPEVIDVVTHAARSLLKADGITFVMRDGDLCHYVDEDAIGPLWKGRRFPLSACISGWCMEHGRAVVIPDIYQDDRIPQDAYRPTFVHSLAMAPVRQEEPIAALGAYWAKPRTATAAETELLQTIANAAALAIAFVQLRQERPAQISSDGSTTDRQPGRAAPGGSRRRDAQARGGGNIVGARRHTSGRTCDDTREGMMTMMRTLLAIGTGKGLFLATSVDDRMSWQVSGPHFPMTGVYAVAVDKRQSPPRLLVGMTSSHFGPSVATSDDLGVSWREPDQAPLAFPADTGVNLGRVWQLAPGTPAEPDVVYAGTEPSALFRSVDGGATFELVRPLWDHPHRKDWDAGFGGQPIHTVLPDPRDPARIVVAMSTGGVYRTGDAGATWTTGNTGIRAYFLPDQWPEFGQCVHKIARDAGDADRLYAQNHHGVYRSDDAGATWTSIADGLPSDFGFPMVAHPRRSGVIYNFPLVADGERFPADHRCRVFRSADAGATWQPLSAGLPAGPYYPAVLRDAMCVDDADRTGVYFGTRAGEVYASRDEGDSWTLVTAHLPDVLCLRAGQV